MPQGDMYGWWCGCVVVGWMLVTEMMGWMCGVGCHSLHRAEALCWVMSPLQGRWEVVVPLYVGPRPYAMIYCPYRASITLKGFNNLARGLAPGNQSDCPYDVEGPHPTPPSARVLRTHADGTKSVSIRRLRLSECRAKRRSSESSIKLA